MDDPEPQTSDPGGHEFAAPARACPSPAILIGRRGPAALGPRPHEPLVRRGRLDAGRAGRGSRRLGRRLDQIDGTRARCTRWSCTPGCDSSARRTSPAGPSAPLCGLATVAGHLRDRPHGLRRPHGALGRLAGRGLPADGLLFAGSADVRLAGPPDDPLVARPAVIPQAAGPARCLVYGLLLTALAYSHPLGLFMIAAHGLAYLAGPARPLAPISVVALDPGRSRPGHPAVAPAVPRPRDRLPDAALFDPIPAGGPIEYIGGNSLVLLVCLAIIAFGLLGRERAIGDRRRLRSTTRSKT